MSDGGDELLWSAQGLEDGAGNSGAVEVDKERLRALQEVVHTLCSGTPNHEPQADLTTNGAGADMSKRPCTLLRSSIAGKLLDPVQSGAMKASDDDARQQEALKRLCVLRVLSGSVKWKDTVIQSIVGAVKSNEARAIQVHVAKIVESGEELLSRPWVCLKVPAADHADQLAAAGAAVGDPSFTVIAASPLCALLQSTVKVQSTNSCLASVMLLQAGASPVRGSEVRLLMFLYMLSNLYGSFCYSTFCLLTPFQLCRMAAFRPCLSL